MHYCSFSYQSHVLPSGFMTESVKCSHCQPRATQQRRNWGTNTQSTLLPLLLSWWCFPAGASHWPKQLGARELRDWLMRLMQCLQLPSHRAGCRSLEKHVLGGTNKISNAHIATFTFLNTGLRASVCASSGHPPVLGFPYFSSWSHQLMLWH